MSNDDLSGQDPWDVASMLLRQLETGAFDHVIDRLTGLKAAGRTEAVRQWSAVLAAIMVLRLDQRRDREGPQAPRPSLATALDRDDPEWRNTARALLDQFGDQAPVIARRRIAVLGVEADAGGIRVWLGILTAMLELMKTSPGEDNY